MAAGWRLANEATTRSTSASAPACGNGRLRSACATPSGPPTDKGLALCRPKVEKVIAGAVTHFINCHGAPADPLFYGQRGARLPSRTTRLCLAADLGRNCRDRPVLLLEPSCTTGDERPQHGSAYVPRERRIWLPRQLDDCLRPAEGNGSADLLCQFFIQRVLAGASLGVRRSRPARPSSARPMARPGGPQDAGQFSLMVTRPFTRCAGRGRFQAGRSELVP